MFVVAAFVMRNHPGIAGVLVTIGSAMLAVSFAFARRYEALAAAVARCDIDAIERFADKSLVYRYHALVLVGLLGSVERARSHGRVTPCVCGHCEPEKLDHDLDRALRAIELIERGKPVNAVRLLNEAKPDSLSLAYGMHHALMTYAALLSGKLSKEMVLRMAPLPAKLASMRWPMEWAIASALEPHDVGASTERLARVPAALRERLSASRATQSKG
jgi:hypothetical protein